MDICIVDLIGVPDLRLLLHEAVEFVRSNALNINVHCFSIHVLGVGDTSGIGIVLPAAQEADVMSGTAEMLPGAICQSDSQLLRLSREAIAKPSATFTLQFITGEIFNFVPEGASCLLFVADRNVGRNFVARDIYVPDKYVTTTA